jgi:short-subunit dehydrogenase
LQRTRGVEQLWEEISSLGRKIDVACINAGVGVGGLFAETDLDAELNMVNLNCVGTIQLSKYIVRDMTARGNGKILFTASIAGEMVAPREAVYAASAKTKFEGMLANVTPGVLKAAMHEKMAKPL